MEVSFQLYKTLSESFLLDILTEFLSGWKNLIHIYKITNLFSFLFTSQTINYLIYSFNGSHAA